MNTTVRFAGAQLPVTTSIELNLISIKQAIDWASENKVDYLVTPEASLSGYAATFNILPDILSNALKEIEIYAFDKQVGLCLGTLWPEKEQNGEINRNQIRFYDKQCRLVGITNKNVTIEQDAAANIVRDPIVKGIMLPVNDSKFIPAGGLICVDMYGDTFGADQTYRPDVPNTFAKYGAKLLIHATNGRRGDWEVCPEETELSDEVSNGWHDAVFKRLTFLNKIPIITVDNCYKIDGSEYHGSTSSESGVIINGRWVTSVPRTGTQYFYYDFLLDDIAIDIPAAPSLI